MDDLLADHTRARGLVKALSEAKERQARGEGSSLEDIATSLKQVAGLYPGHIKKEEQFFLPGMEYFPEAEQQAMLARFYQFDRQVIHQKYQAVVAELEKEKR
ncbi:MAG: hemerythrin domain-containing protein [Chloroflexota bacterium]